MTEIYQRVAERFVGRIHDVWASEETLKSEFEKNFKAISFTRTDHWQPIIHYIFRSVWMEAGPEVKGEPTGYDKMMVMRLAHSRLDYNIFTQVLLNLQNYVGMGYAVEDAEKEIADLKDKWPKDAKLDPFASGGKMVKAASTFEEIAYNNILSTQRAHKIIADFSGGTSFRVSPKGSTPAFADSKNISMIGVGGDKYLRTLTSMLPYYITWETAPRMTTLAENILVPGVSGVQGMAFSAPGIPYAFFSKSGGEILNEVLFARKIMYEVFRGVDITQKQCIQIPRMNSVLVITGKPAPDLKIVVEGLEKRWPGVLSFWEGARG
jgi:hypothetical protein